MNDLILDLYDEWLWLDERINKVTDEIEAVIKARKGQGTFRRNVEKLEAQCRVAGLCDKRLLIANHIKPWRVCDTAAERLDDANGLLLAPHIDRLFDRGLITFHADGVIHISEDLDHHSKACLSLPAAEDRGVGAFSAEQERYLEYHHENVFIG